MFLLFVIGDSIGLNYFVFSTVLCCSNLFSGDFYIVDAMFRASSLINSLFQSTPQIVLQIYNNMQYNNWSVLTLTSISLSGLSLLYTIAKLVYAVDKMKQYESISIDHTARSLGAKSHIVVTNSGKDIRPIDSVRSESNGNNEEEVYEASKSG